MKNFKLLTLTFIAVLGTLTTSCGSDDDAGTPAVASEFTFDSTTYALSKGLIENLGDNGNGTFDFDITLLSSGINFDTATETFSGNGEVLFLDLNSDNMTQLSDGTYNFATARTAFSLVDAFVVLDFDAAAQTGTGTQSTGGNVVVTKNGSEYTIIAELVTATGATISGSYKGTLTAL